MPNSDVSRGLCIFSSEKVKLFPAHGCKNLPRPNCALRRQRYRSKLRTRLLSLDNQLRGDLLELTILMASEIPRSKTLQAYNCRTAMPHHTNIVWQYTVRAGKIGSCARTLVLPLLVGSRALVFLICPREQVF